MNPALPNDAFSPQIVNSFLYRITEKNMRRLFVLSLCVLLAFSLPTQAAPVAETWRDDPGLLKYFREAGLNGTIVVMDAHTGAWTSADSRRAFVPYLPASTFKIPNTLIALETGVARDENQPYAWDHKRRGLPGWDEDQTLSSAFRNSVVWVYQGIARDVGNEQMQQYLRAFRYGNARITPAIDRFWLEGDLRITAVEQVDFLRRFAEGKLPLSAHTIEVGRKVMLREHTAHYSLFWKTGLTGGMAPQPDIGWFVGWIERDEGRVYFALNADVPKPALWPAREAVARRVLASMGYLD